MGRTLWAICGLTALAFFGPSLPTSRAAEKDAADEQTTFEMKEVSILDAKDEEIVRYAGIYVDCTNKPAETVKAYPKLKSKRPLYGTFEIDRDRFRGHRGTEYHFVLDASAEPKKAESKSLLGALAAALKGAESQEVENYDLLYFDANHDLDLTNDPVVKPMKDPPARLLSFAFAGRPIKVFDYLPLPVDYGPGIGTRALRIVPALTSLRPNHAALRLVPGVFRQGMIRLGKHQYSAVLSQEYTGRFDRPMTLFRLKPTGDPADRPPLWDTAYLFATRVVDGQLYNISATPTGDRLFVKPYRGDFGVLEVAPGGRDIKSLCATGILISDNDRLLQVGESPQSPLSESEKEKLREHRLPVGDYKIGYLAVEFGPLSFAVRSADDLIVSPEQRRQEPLVYPIKIRKDKPCILDFSAKPTVTFANPRGDQTFKPGDTVKIEAFLVDPALNLLIGSLTCTSKEVGKEGFTTDKEGKRGPVPRSLDPTVEITNSAGEKIADGKMPFG